LLQFVWFFCSTLVFWFPGLFSSLLLCFLAWLCANIFRCRMKPFPASEKCGECFLSPRQHDCFSRPVEAYLPSAMRLSNDCSFFFRASLRFLFRVVLSCFPSFPRMLFRATCQDLPPTIPTMNVPDKNDQPFFPSRGVGVSLVFSFLEDRNTTPPSILRQFYLFSLSFYFRLTG